MHQLFRLRYAKNMLDVEALAITKNLAEGVKTYDQVVEVISKQFQTFPNPFPVQRTLNSDSAPSVAPCITASWWRLAVSRVCTVS